MSRKKDSREIRAEEEEQTESWRAKLPDDLKENEDLARFDNPGDLGREYLGLKGKAENSTQIPSEDADEEEWAEFYRKIGRPESAEGYGLIRPDNLPEYIPYDDGMEQSFRQAALTLNLSDAQAKGLFEWYHENVRDAHSAVQEEREQQYAEAEKSLKQELGQKYGESLELARRAVRTFGGEEMAALLEESGLGNHPAVFRTFFNIAKAVADDTLVSGSPETEAKTGMLETIYPKMKK